MSFSKFVYSNKCIVNRTVKLLNSNLSKLTVKIQRHISRHATIGSWYFGPEAASKERKLSFTSMRISVRKRNNKSFNLKSQNSITSQFRKCLLFCILVYFSKNLSFAWLDKVNSDQIIKRTIFFHALLWKRCSNCQFALVSRSDAYSIEWMWTSQFIHLCTRQINVTWVHY